MKKLKTLSRKQLFLLITLVVVITGMVVLTVWISHGASPSESIHQGQTPQNAVDETPMDIVEQPTDHNESVETYNGQPLPGDSVTVQSADSNSQAISSDNSKPSQSPDSSDSQIHPVEEKPVQPSYGKNELPLDRN